MFNVVIGIVIGFIIGKLVTVAMLKALWAKIQGE